MPGFGMGFGDWIKSVRDDGLESASDRWYSFYPATVKDDTDPSQQGKSKIHSTFIGFPSPHPRLSYPVSPYAGRNHGFYFPQHAGEPVWVTCDLGDTNSFRVHGGWWGNDSDDDPKKPEDSHVPAEFIKSDGGAPTARGIKTRGGHVLIFEDDPNNAFTELSSGANIVDDVPVTDAQNNQVTDNQGQPVTKPVIRVGEVSEKHHRVRLDDTNEEIVIGTFGAESNDDRIQHELLMKDTSDNRFVRVKTIGDDKDKFHQILMSDTDESILIKSTDEHFWEISDKDERFTWETKSKFRGEVNQKNEFIVWETPGNRELRMSDKDSKITLKDEKHELTFDDSGTLLKDTTGSPITVEGDGDFQGEFAGNHDLTVGANASEDVTGNKDVVINGTMNVEVKASWTHRVLAAAQMIITGALTIQASSVTVTSGDVKIGTGNLQPLMNELAIDIINGHTHLLTGPGTALPPGPILAKGVHSTLATKGA